MRRVGDDKEAGGGMSDGTAMRSLSCQITRCELSRISEKHLFGPDAVLTVARVVVVPEEEALVVVVVGVTTGRRGKHRIVGGGVDGSGEVPAPESPLLFPFCPLPSPLPPGSLSFSPLPPSEPP